MEKRPRDVLSIKVIEEEECVELLEDAGIFERVLCRQQILAF